MRIMLNRYNFIQSILNRSVGFLMTAADGRHHIDQKVQEAWQG
jgi:hypothetical protein